MLQDMVEMCLLYSLNELASSTLSYLYMDPGWDHTENEDKLLLAHTLWMGKDTHRDMYNSDEVRSVSRSGCYTFSNVSVVDTRLDYNQQILSIVINAINHFYLFLFSDLKFLFSFYHFYYPVNRFYAFICEICKISNSESKCECNSTCNSNCKGNFICLCLCSNSKGEGSNGCCICICKKDESSCKCICICICNKNGTKCCCESGGHECKQPLVKVDIQSLISKTWTILCHLRWIRCYISRLENKCCSCSCCLITCCGNLCCTECQNNCKYFSCIKSKIYKIEEVFKTVRSDVENLRKLFDIIQSKCLFMTICQICKCYIKLNNLIQNISKSLSYYDKIEPRMYRFKYFVEYNMFFRCSKGSIQLRKSTINIILMISKHTETKFIIKQLLNSSEIYNKILLVIDEADRCVCVRNVSNKDENYKFHITGFYSNIHGDKKLTFDLISKMVKVGNDHCLCMVIKFILYPMIYKCINYIINRDNDLIKTINRSFNKSKYFENHNIRTSNILYLVLILIYKISVEMQNRYLSAFSNIQPIPDLYCFCRAPNDKYYLYYITIILVLSSLMENIWSMDTEGMRMAIECLSTLYSQLEIYDLSSVNDTKKLSCNSIYTLLLNKQFKEKDTCQCKEGKKCCCWCVTCFNLLVMLIYLCLQCKLCKAKCNNTNKPKGCKKIEDYFTKIECECKCPKEKKELCCLLKLGLSGVVGCQELEKLKECCESCKKEDGCCKKILENLKKGLCKLLLLGCCCNDGKCDCDSSSDGQLKGWWLMFDNGCTSVAVLVFCKCKDPGKGCCCLSTLIEKFKGKVSKICEDECICKELQKCEDLCCKGCAGCVCEQLKKSLDIICNGQGEKCNGNDGKCLCEEIKKCLENLCKNCCDTSKQCECKDKGCCKLVGMSIKILTRACRANVLEPYKRITIELLNSTKNKKDVIRTIVEGINRTTLNNIYLVKNNLITSTRYPYSVGSYPGTINGVTNVETRNWGYDTKYEYDVSTVNSFINTIVILFVIINRDVTTHFIYHKYLYTY